MSQYVDNSYYINTYKGKIKAGELEEYLKLASEKIDEVTFNRIVGIGFDNLTDFQKEKVKESVCAQADYIYENGYNDEDNVDFASYSVLDITVNAKDIAETNTEAKKKHMSSYAYDQINKTGLTCRSYRW